jgi:16S rRNA (guanine966-N2)-methyltransferase
VIRITGGDLRGRHLEVPAGIRPTTELARKAAFDILGPAIRGTRVLDAAAGSGAYGIEALSRGASHATFVEKDRRNAGILAANLSKVDLAPRSLVVVSTIAGFLARASTSRERFEIVFHDPPYDADSDADLGGLLGCLPPGGILIHERGDDHVPVVEARDVPEPEHRRYGRTHLLLYRRPAGNTLG